MEFRAWTIMSSLCILNVNRPVFLIVICPLVVYSYLFIYFGLEFRRQAVRHVNFAREAHIPIVRCWKGASNPDRSIHSCATGHKTFNTSD